MTRQTTLLRWENDAATGPDGTHYLLISARPLHEPRYWFASVRRPNDERAYGEHHPHDFSRNVERVLGRDAALRLKETKRDVKKACEADARAIAERD